MLCKMSFTRYGIADIYFRQYLSMISPGFNIHIKAFAQKRWNSSCGNEYPTSCIVEYRQKQVSNKISIVKKLGKMRLTLFVAASSLAGSILSNATPFYAGILFIGVTLISLSANTANQCLEMKEDSLMNRTKLRPLVTGEISHGSAVKVCAGEFVCGSYFLYLYSVESCILGIFNWFLYVACYTPSKKLTIYNTELGAIVGAIPPLMGGLYSYGATSALSSAAWLGLILYIWQIPHFIALSFLCRRDYLNAGYQMQASFSVQDSLQKFLLYTLGLGSVVFGGPFYLDLSYPSFYYFSSSLLFTAVILKSLLFCYHPVRYCRECFRFSYLWLLMQLLLIILAHYAVSENKDKKRIE